MDLVKHRPASIALFCAFLATAVVAQDRRDDTLAPGQMAPDFTLSPRDTGGPITLSSYRGKQPVALVFGSYT
jgi:hypothetical protein